MGWLYYILGLGVFALLFWLTSALDVSGRGRS